MKTRILLLIAVFFLGSFVMYAQDRPVHPSSVVTGTFIGISKPLRDLPKITQQELDKLAERSKTKQLNESLKLRSFPFAATALPKGPDPVWQKTMGESAGSKAPIANFTGQDSPYYPPDCNGAAGPSHYMETINCVYSIYNKSGTLVAGPTAMNTLFGSVPGATYNDGDPVVLYDEQAGRWLATEFSISGSTNYVMMAVSTTSDPTGTWYQYSFVVATMPDYPKFGVWRDGYYMGDNNPSAKDIYVFQRSQMLIGGTALSVGFDNPYRPTSVDGFMMVPPVDNDGTFAPAGSPGTFIAFNDDAVGGGSDQLWIYELTVDWTNTANSTFNRVQQLAVAAFSSNFGSDQNNIFQSGTTQRVDAIPQVIMNVPQYRNFGTYQTIVCCHTVNVDNNTSTDHAGIRWYELRRAAGVTNSGWSIRQQGTYAPDANSRWMGSIMLNGSGKIALGYSIAGSSMFPGIRYCGQSTSAYNTGAGVLDLPEEIIQTGAYSQTGQNRWGDYSNMSVDPSDDNTFWFASEYIGSGGARKTKIASFKYGNSPAIATLAATSVTPTSATINGTVNPNGLATTYYFDWGTSVSYGNQTTVTSAGSGTSIVAVSANLTGLTAGVTYHFRVVATNSDGTGTGTDMSFTPALAVVTTTAPSAITGSTATTGGNVTADGGLSITACGICWSTSALPTIAGNHTTDGSGIGAFTTYLTGLSGSTTYHIRAYATNAGGTYYGDDFSFTTACGTISVFPWTEGFENGGLIPNCWTQEQVASSGLYYTFITGNGGSNPASAHGGTYNACLSDITTADNSTKLITPSINLALLSSPQLKFYHTQAALSGKQDKLTVYYKTSAGGTWTVLNTYTTSITSWTLETISLPGATSDYYIAFEGDAKYGYGVCIDDVSITGTVIPSLTVTPADQPVSAAAGTASFSVTTGLAWTATSNQSWCTVTPSGTGSGTLIATYSQNTTLAQRTASITVTVSGVTPVVVTVTQAAPTLAVTPSTQVVTATPGTTPFTVTSNSAWTATSNQTWCTVTPSGSGSGTITATYLLNNTTSARVANVTVTVTGLTPIVVTVSQAAPTLSVTPSNQAVAAASGTTPFTVTSNSAWTATSNQSWCTVTASGSGSGTVTATYTANTVQTPRTANITVTVAGLTPIVVTVSQAAADPPDIIYTIANDVQTSDRILEFDLYLLNNKPATPLELSMIQTGILVNSGIINGGTLTPTIIAGSSGLVTTEQPNSISLTTGSPNACIKIAARSLPGCGSGTIISTTGLGTRICRLRITNSVAFTANSYANLNFNFAGVPFLITKVYQYSGTPCTSTQMTTTTTNCYSIATNPMLNGPPSLSVTPSNQGVTSPAGVTSFTVTSNTSWTASSNQSWCTINTSGFGSGTITANYTQNTGVTRVASITVTVTGLSPIVVTVTQVGNTTKTLNLSSIFLEGLYNGYSTMFQAADVYYDAENNPSIAPKWSDGSADHINIELHLSTTHYDAGCDCQVSDYPTIAYSATDIPLSTTGTASATIPAVNNGSYYVTIKHRNSIETTTALPVSFAGGTISYAFDAASKAYGNNMTFMLEADGTTLSPPLIFGGDVNQDEQVEAEDMNQVGNAASTFVYGYVPADVYGDGQVEASDINITGNNAASFVYAHFPM